MPSKCGGLSSTVVRAVVRCCRLRRWHLVLTKFHPSFASNQDHGPFGHGGHAQPVDLDMDGILR